MRRIGKGIGLVLIVVFSLAVVIFLPEYVARGKDKEYLNQFQLYAQDTSDIIYTDLSLEEKMQMLMQLNEVDESDYCVLETVEAEKVLESDSALFDEVKKQLLQLEEMELIPVISESFDLKELLETARLYAITSSEQPGRVFYIWALSFRKENGDYCSFAVDVVDYQIYELSVVSQEANFYNESFFVRLEKTGGDFYDFYMSWFKDYVLYLQGDIVKGEQEITINDLKWDDINCIGMLGLNSMEWKMNCSFAESSDYFSFSIDGIDKYEKQMDYDSMVNDDLAY